MSSSACFMIESGNKVSSSRGADLRALRVSAFTPALRLDKYESLLSRVVFAMFTKTNSVKRSIALAIA